MSDRLLRLPTAIRSGEFRIGSLVVRCCVLDDGRRIVDAESVIAFARWMDDPDVPAADVRAFAERFGRWLRGEDSDDR